MTRAELLERLDVLLGGRVAEEIIFGDVSTGAHDDLQRASDLARHMVTQYSMSDELGLETFERPRQPLFLNGPVVAERGYSEETARTIDQEIRKLLAGAHIRGRETLTAKRSVLEALAKLLIEEEVVDRDALTALLATPLGQPLHYPPPARLDAQLSEFSSRAHPAFISPGYVPGGPCSNRYAFNPRGGEKL